MLRWLKRVGWALLVVLLLGVALLYGASEWALHRSHTVPTPEIAVNNAPAAVAEGARLAKLFGCHSCHGGDNAGTIVTDDVLLGTFVAPGLVRTAAASTDAELARAIQQGVRRDGGAIYVMPTDIYARLSDRDVAALIAWMRALPKPPRREREGMASPGPLGRLMLLGHLIRGGPQTARLAAPNRPEPDGAYLVAATCLDCHGLHTQGTMPSTNEAPPPLAPSTVPYDLAQFTALMRKGEGRSSANLGSMTHVARERLSAMTDNEIAAVHAYLQQEAQRP